MANILESYTITTPQGSEDTCAKFTIDDLTNVFLMPNVTVPEFQYSFSFWVKSDEPGRLVIRGKEIPTTTQWLKNVITYTADSTDLEIPFGLHGVYYFYHTQLEIGNKPTDWTTNPDDVDETINKTQVTADSAKSTADSVQERLDYSDSLIKQLQDSISMLVQDANGNSLMTQTADGGWTFSMAQTMQTVEDIQKTLAELDGYIDSLDASMVDVNKALDNVESDIEWIKMTTYEDEPCIALGETGNEDGNDFKLLITNTRIMFFDGTDIPAYITNKALHITNAVIEEELQQGPFVWTIRANGNMGLLWKGVSS